MQITKTFSSGPLVSLDFQRKQNGEMFILLKPGTHFSTSFDQSIPAPLCHELLDWLLAYSLKKSAPLPPIPRKILPPFSEKAIDSLEKVPFGETISYQALAKLAGNSKACRAIGTICRLNSFPLLIPCHRVLPKGRSLGNYAFGSDIKKALLEFEGAFFQNS